MVAFKGKGLGHHNLEYVPGRFTVLRDSQIVNLARVNSQMPRTSLKISMLRRKTPTLRQQKERA